LNHACRYASHLIVMKEGAIVAEGDPAKVVTAELVEEVFGLPVRIIPDPETGTPMIVPVDRRGAAR
ncbi:ABC transporter ATP-binding protein, partial [Nocardiopsis tropica]|nr:ABC transporter ATP-binding protein [Nocardiopsis tropica]